MAKMHTYWGNGAFFPWNLSAFLLHSPELKSSLVYMIFWIPMQSSWSHHLPMHCTWTHLLSSMPPMQLTQHFHWGNIYFLFTLGNKCTSCCFSSLSIWSFLHTTHAIYVAFLLGHLHPVYFRKQVYFLLCHPRNSHGMSKVVFKSIFNMTIKHLQINQISASNNP